MKQSTPFWPRGLLVGALLAVFLIIPVFVVMLFDAARGVPDAKARFAMFQHPLQMRASGDFFDGKLAVQAVLSRRFGMLPPPDSAKSNSDRRDHFAGQSSAEVVRSGLFRLRLENHSAQNLSIEIVRVASGLGDFSGQPDHVILAPHQSTSIDSVVAEQKITSGSIPVAVALRLDGNVETHRLLLNESFLAQANNH